jgi:hypothetical protein
MKERRDRKGRQRRDETDRRDEGRAKLLSQVRRRFSEHAAQVARRSRRSER